MAKVKRVVELSLEEKEFLDKFLNMLYEEFEDWDDEDIGGVMADIYNTCLGGRPLPQTYEGEYVEVTVVRGEVIER